MPTTHEKEIFDMHLEVHEWAYLQALIQQQHSELQLNPLTAPCTLLIDNLLLKVTAHKQRAADSDQLLDDLLLDTAVHVHVQEQDEEQDDPDTRRELVRVTPQGKATLLLDLPSPKAEAAAHPRNRKLTDILMHPRTRLVLNEYGCKTVGDVQDLNMWPVVRDKRCTNLVQREICMLTGRAQGRVLNDDFYRPGVEPRAYIGQYDTCSWNPRTGTWTVVKGLERPAPGPEHAPYQTYEACVLLADNVPSNQVCRALGLNAPQMSYLLRTHQKFICELRALPAVGPNNSCPRYSYGQRVFGVGRAADASSNQQQLIEDLTVGDRVRYRNGKAHDKAMAEAAALCTG